MNQIKPHWNSNLFRIVCSIMETRMYILKWILLLLIYYCHNALSVECAYDCRSYLDMLSVLIWTSTSQIQRAGEPLSCMCHEALHVHNYLCFLITRQERWQQTTATSSDMDLGTETRIAQMMILWVSAYREIRAQHFPKRLLTVEKSHLALAFAWIEVIPTMLFNYEMIL